MNLEKQHQKEEELSKTAEKENTSLMRELENKGKELQREKKLSNELSLRNLKLQTLTEQMKKALEVGRSD